VHSVAVEQKDKYKRALNVVGSNQVQYADDREKHASSSIDIASEGGEQVQ
jgi:hypothetical protein